MKIKTSFNFINYLSVRISNYFFAYAYVCINDVILFFGGQNGKVGPNRIVSKSVHKYLIRENKWMICESTLPSLLYGSAGILSEDNTYVHIVGGYNGHGQLKVEKEEKKEENDRQDVNVSVTFLLYLYLMTNYK
ncbi:hypothetical protein RFI_34540 [Reticulomyxa filosa]|uniref:Uncharacterized protein n=1 Tax=Reticulomyxa filosa TaxID=46433 RepID=X6LLU8_RETFI|nr:hypothetical protein RFI_34540 [Reticulomyxa filosa]|eukprot:ETO02873.1 hypothetical protein RFI_34540 [Reticulomyxa filosa]